MRLYWSQFRALCRRKMFRLLAHAGESIVYTCKWIKASQKLVKKWYLLFNMVQIIHSNPKTLYLWWQEFFSRFLRCAICISLKLLCQGTFCLAATFNRSITLTNFLNEENKTFKFEKRHVSATPVPPSVYGWTYNDEQYTCIVEIRITMVWYNNWLQKHQGKQ